MRVFAAPEMGQDVALYIIGLTILECFEADYPNSSRCTNYTFCVYSISDLGGNVFFVLPF